MSWKDIVKADYIKTKDRASVEDMFLDRVMQNDLPHVLRVYYEENKKAFHADIKGDTFFPNIDMENWKEVDSKFHEKDEKHKFSFTFFKYEKCN